MLATNLLLAGGLDRAEKILLSISSARKKGSHSRQSTKNYETCDKMEHKSNNTLYIIL
jgi:hypothetical protein